MGENGDSVQTPVEVKTEVTPVPQRYYSGLDAVAHSGKQILRGLALVLFLTGAGIAVGGGPAPGTDRAKYNREASVALYGCFSSLLLSLGATAYEDRENARYWFFKEEQSKPGLKS